MKELSRVHCDCCRETTLHRRGACIHCEAINIPEAVKDRPRARKLRKQPILERSRVRH